MIDIPFNDWSDDQHYQDRKRGTTRTERYGAPGDRFETAGRLFELTHVVKLPLGVVGEYFYEVEGADSPTEFESVWNDIHYQRGYDPHWQVWLHLYREVADG